MSHQSRGIKRKEREALYPATSSTNVAEPQLTSDRLLAGYMAYEFLANGTLLGEQFDPDMAGAEPLRRNWLSQVSKEGETSEKPKLHSYFEMANLVKNKEVHIPGVVNPTQLARWLRP